MAEPTFRVAQTLSGNAPATAPVTYTANGAIAAGAFVTLEAAGTVVTAGDDVSAVLGLAMNTAANGEQVNVIWASDDVIFSGLRKGGAYVAADAGGLFALDSDGVDLDDIIAPVAAIVHGVDPTADTNQGASERVLFSINQAAFQGPGGVAVA